MKAELRRCPLLSLPNNKLIPDARWILDSVGQHDIVARSQARADVEHGDARARGPDRARQRRGVPARQRRVRRGDRRLGDDPARPGPADGLPAHLHEPLLRGVCQLLSSSPTPPTPAAGRSLGVAPIARGRGRGRGSPSCCSPGSGCACGASRRGCRTPTTPTRPTTSCRTRSRCSSTARSTRTTSPTRPRYTYLLHFLFAVVVRRRRRRRCTRSRCTPRPSTRSRASPPRCSARSRCGCCTRPARACFGRAVGLLAAAIEAVAFLPVFYAHLALNDVPTLAPADAVAARDRRRAAQRPRPRLPARRRRARARLRHQVHRRDRDPAAARGDRCTLLDGGPTGRGRRGAARSPGSRARRAALAAFVLANPYSLLDYTSFHAELVHQSTLSAESQGKLGAPKRRRAHLLPVVAHLGARLGARARRARRGAHGLATRAPARLAARARAACCSSRSWACRAATSGAGCCRSSRSCACSRRASRRAARRLGAGGPCQAPAPRVALAALLVAALLAQGLVYSVHSGLVLSRADTRNLTRAWMLAHIPAGATIVVEPVAPDEWAQRSDPRDRDRAQPLPLDQVPRRCSRGSTLAGALTPAHRRKSGIENYERTLAPGADRLLRAQRLLLGDQRLDRVRARVRRPHGRARRRSPTTARSRATATVVYRASPYGRGPGARVRSVQLRLELRLLPARLRAAGAADDDLPAARRSLPRRVSRIGATARVILDRGMPSCTDTDKLHLGARDRARAQRRRGGQAEPGRRRRGRARRRDPRRGLAPANTAARTRRSTRSRRAAWRTSTGATLYVSLEPCCHEGKTPPCTDAILQAGIGRVVVASDDPTEKASGRGLGILRDEGVEVVIADGELAAQRAAAQPGVPQARPRRAPVGAVQVGDDARRQGRHAHRRLEVDQRRGQPRARASLARVGRRGRRRDRHGARRRPAADGAPGRHAGRARCAAAARRVRLARAAAAQLAAGRGRRRDPADDRRLARGRARRHRRARSRRRAGARGDRRKRARARALRHSTSWGRSASPRCCSRAARISRARSSTPARSTKSGCSSRRCCSAAARRATRSRAKASSASPRRCARSASTASAIGEDLLDLGTPARVVSVRRRGLMFTGLIGERGRRSSRTARRRGRDADDPQPASRASSARATRSPSTACA